MADETMIKFAICGLSALEVMLHSPNDLNELKQKLLSDQPGSFLPFRVYKGRTGTVRVDRNSKGDTPLILAARLCDKELMNLCLDDGNYTEDSGVSKDSLLADNNDNNENAFLVALQAALEKALSSKYVNEGPLNDVMEFFTPNVEQSKRHLQQKNSRKQNGLHLLFSVIGKYQHEPTQINNRKWSLAQTVLEWLKKEKIRINPLAEDDRGLTPLFYLIRYCSSEKVWRSFRNYCESECFNGKDLRWEDLLQTQCGMDIVHARAGYECIEFLFKDDASEELKDELQPENKLVGLYKNEKSLFASSIVLGGRIDGGSRSRKGKHSQWTALHFAFKRGMRKNMAFLMRKGFSPQDTTAKGETCTELAQRRGVDLEEVLGAFEEATRDSDRSHIEHYAASVDCVKCALDDCSKQCTEGEAITESHADDQTDKAIRRDQRLRQQDGHQPQKRTPKEKVQDVMWLCFENDDTALYRYLLHSSAWKVCQLSQDSESQLPTDEEYMEAFDHHRTIRYKQEKRPKKTRWQFRIKDLNVVLRFPSFKTRGQSTPFFKYLNNGNIFHHQLLKNPQELMAMSLIDLAVRTGRPEMAKALLITRQMDLIPRAVATISTCQKMIQKEHLVNYYPIRDTNNHLKGVKAFAGKVAMNAIDILFRGCCDEDAKLIFRYLQGEISESESAKADTQGAGQEKPKKKLPSAKLITSSGSLKRKEEPPHRYSTLDLVRKTMKVDFFATECFQQLVQQMWNRTEPVMKSSSSSISPQQQSEVDAQQHTGNFRKSVNFFRTPRRKLMTYGFMNVVFIFFLVFGITHPSVDYNWTDIVIGLFLIGFVVQEIHELCIRATTTGEGYGSYFFDIWNCYDIVMIALIVAGFSIKGYFVTQGRSTWGDVDDAGGSKISRFGNDNVWMFFNYKMVMSTALLLSCVKFLKILRYVQSVGQNLVIMPTIFVKDLFPFVIILTLFVLSFGTFFFVSLTVGRYGFSINSTTTTVRRSDDVVFDLYVRPLLVAFGEFELDGIHDCSGDPRKAGESNACYYQHGVDVFKRFILIFFVMVVNLVMFNMLIARFSNTVSRYDMRSCKIWLSLRDEMLIDYRYLTSLPPPFNIFGSLWILGDRLNARRNNGSDTCKSHEIAKFYRFQAQRFSHKRHDMQRMHVETIEDDIKEKLEGEDNLNAGNIEIQFNSAPRAADS